MLLVWAVATVLSLLILARRRLPGSRPAPATIPICVIVIAVALMLVGVVSNTMRIHAVQIVPLLAIVALLRWKPRWSAVASVPLFTFWLLVMGGIWLFLLGISRFFTGRFTTTEIVLTLVMGVASVIGIAASYRQGTLMAGWARVLAVSAIAAMQAAAVWLSYFPIVRGE